MSTQSLPPGRPADPAPARRTWDLGAGDPATVLAGARRALFVMVGILAVLWIIQIINSADHYDLSLRYGIQGRDVASATKPSTSRGPAAAARPPRATGRF